MDKQSDTRIDKIGKGYQSEYNYILNFQRYEYKYLIPKNMIENLINDLLLYMNFDKYSDGNYYDIHSVYFDTQNWDSYYEKIDGIERRKKFRVRSYYKDCKKDTPVFFEIKEKNKDIILKRRFHMNYEKVNDFVNMDRKESGLAQDEWRYGLTKKKLIPRILISYKRMAFVPRFSGDYRITLDRDIRYALVAKNVRFDYPTLPLNLTKQYSVLEVKFRKVVPSFIPRLIKKYDLRNEAVSKYCESIVNNYKLIL